MCHLPDAGVEEGLYSIPVFPEGKGKVGGGSGGRSRGEGRGAEQGMRSSAGQLNRVNVR